MDLSDAAVEDANLRGEARKASFPTVVSVRYDRCISRIVISLSSGLDIAFAPRDAQGFEHAQPSDLVDAEISPSGLGVHFPKIDTDIYVPALLEGFLGSRRWIAAQNGKTGGSSSTAEKSAAARENGKKGGRPKKTKAHVDAD